MPRAGRNAKDDDAKIVQRTPNDILCGRGVPILNYHGNIRLHTIIDSYRDRYLKSERKAKPRLVMEIVKDIKAGGARFLKRSRDDLDSSWVEVSDAYSHEKVRNALRCKKAAAKAKEMITKSSPSRASADAAAKRPAFDNNSTSSDTAALPPELRQPLHAGMIQMPQNPIASAPLVAGLSTLPQRRQEYRPPNTYMHPLDPQLSGINALSRLSSPSHLAILSHLQGSLMRNTLPYFHRAHYPLGLPVQHAGLTPMHPALTGIGNPYMTALLVAQGLSVQLPVGDATVDRLLAIRASHSTRTTGDTVTLTSLGDGVSQHPLSGQSTQLPSGDTPNDRFLAQKRSPSSTRPDGNTTNNS